jgi:hypothetical protein
MRFALCKIAQLNNKTHIFFALPNVLFGSLGDMGARSGDVRFAPESEPPSVLLRFPLSKHWTCCAS